MSRPVIPTELPEGVEDTPGNRYYRRNSAKLRANGKCLTCFHVDVVPGKSRCAKHLALANENQKKYVQEAKREAFAAYGPCSCCGERELSMLSIDHIEGRGSGAKHRREVEAGVKFYKWLKAQNYPKDKYRSLCFSCNFSASRHPEGICAHKLPPEQQYLV